MSTESVSVDPKPPNDRVNNSESSSPLVNASAQPSVSVEEASPRVKLP